MESTNPFPDEITQPGQYGRLRVYGPLEAGNPTPEELTWPVVSLTTGKVVHSGQTVTPLPPFGEVPPPVAAAEAGDSPAR
jgi:hypothetical protein